VEGMGITRPSDEDIEFSTGMEFRIEINGPEESRIMVDSHYDLFYYQYGETLNMIERKDYPGNLDNGIFHDIYYCVNRPLYLPEQEIQKPLDRFHTGSLKWGISDPVSSNFDSNADIFGPGDDGVIEIRIPWLLINAKDPSSRMMTGDIWKEGLEAEVKIGSIGFSIITLSGNGQEKEIRSSYPEMTGGISSGTQMHEYQWNTWDLPVYHERLKTSYILVTESFSEF
jgi:hypothetical protein